MSLHVFANFVTPFGTAANNRAETEGNITTLQKLVWMGDTHSTVSAEADLGREARPGSAGAGDASLAPAISASGADAGQGEGGGREVTGTVVGSGTPAVGTQGGYVMPGLLMGLLQIGWFAVATFFSTDFILKGIGMKSEPGTPAFVIVGILWGVVMSFIGAKGIQYVAKVSLYLNAIPLLMLLYVFFQTAGGIGNYQVAPTAYNPFLAVTSVLAIVIVVNIVTRKTQALVHG